MPSLLDSPSQLPPAGAGGAAWSSLYAAQEPVKPVVVLPAAVKKPVYGGGRKVKNVHLETCTEALGCETGGVDVADADVEDGAERKRRAREEEEHEVVVGGEAGETEGQARSAGRPRGGGALPPPLTTLATRGGGRVRMVRERRDGRLEVYAVRTPGMEAERSGGRLRLRLQLLPCGGGGGNAADCNHQEPTREAGGDEAVGQDVDDEHSVGVFVRGGGRCVQAEGGSATAMHGSKKKWEAPEQAAAFWVATT